MQKYLVHEENVAGSATHALVIGVGDYPHLNRGSGSLSRHHDGMGQLTSPPVSARSYAEWLISNYNNPSRPLSTVALLLAEDHPSTFLNAKSGDRVQVERATYDNTAEAIREWKGRAESDAQGLLVFYFCGHGAATGPDMTLLLSDYGMIQDAPLEHALDFRKFRLGMTRHLPSQQVYFVDACRAGSDTLIEAFDFAGRVPVHPGDKDAAEAPVFYAALAGEDAFGKPGEVSIFTAALIQGLNGAGSDDSEGNWRVTTSRLKEAIDYQVRQAIQAGAERASIPPTDDLTTFELHRLQGEPKVPVFVTCQPESENANAKLFWQNSDTTEGREPQAEEWSLTLPAGEYSFRAEFPDGRRKIEKRAWVRPVYRRVPLEVK